MKAKSEKKRRAVLEEIEPRILYSADFAPALADAAAFVPEAEQRTLEPSGEFIQTSTQDTQTRRHEIVFVDPATPEYQKLIDDIRAQDGDADIEVVLLDLERDGIEQISQTLAGRRDISAMHLISHGAEGSVQLGSSLLNFDSAPECQADQGLGKRADGQRRYPDLWLRCGRQRRRQVVGQCVGTVDRCGCKCQR
jgi:hypothetical protein